MGGIKGAGVRVGAGWKNKIMRNCCGSLFFISVGISKVSVIYLSKRLAAFSALTVGAAKLLRQDLAKNVNPDFSPHLLLR